MTTLTTQPAFADFEDDDDDSAFVRALNSLRRGIIMLFLRAHNSLAAQQAFLLLEVCAAGDVQPSTIHPEHTTTPASS